MKIVCGVQRLGLDSLGRTWIVFASKKSKKKNPKRFWRKKKIVDDAEKTAVDADVSDRYQADCDTAEDAGKYNTPSLILPRYTARVQCD